MAITKQMIIDNEIRGLSWKQPFAELMKHGKVETRTWETEWRGLVLICASVNPYSDRELVAMSGREQYTRILQLLGPKWFNQVKRGSAIAVGRLVACRSMSTTESAEREMEAKTFVKYNPLLHLHIYEDVTPIEPFPWRGQLGWQKVSDEDKAKIKPL